ncbi:MAG TPA: nitrite reductase small subunit NirD [Mycobacteriales bacterium]|nr:nitrite reductase small subunit NirD [Mycobacteriales bacterium]
MSWHPVCPFVRLPVERAVCVLVGGEQVALVRTRDDQVYAVDNLDPVGGAMVMSRGIVGSRGAVDVLISPMHKQAYDLATGECLDLPGIWLGTHLVRVLHGDVEVSLRQQERLLA